MTPHAAPHGRSSPASLDPEALRVLAHPLRSRLLTELRAGGAATATTLAAALATNTGATSYHLRRLEAVGLVVDSGRGSGRQRVWQAVPAGRVGPPPEQPVDDDDAAALAWLARDYVRHFADKAGEWLDTRHEFPSDWQDIGGLSDHLVQVTAEQLVALQADLEDVLARYRRVGAGNPSARRVSVYVCPLPVDRPRRTRPSSHTGSSDWWTDPSSPNTR